MHSYSAKMFYTFELLLRDSALKATTELLSDVSGWIWLSIESKEPWGHTMLICADWYNQEYSFGVMYISTVQRSQLFCEKPAAWAALLGALFECFGSLSSVFIPTHSNV